MCGYDVWNLSNVYRKMCTHSCTQVKLKQACFSRRYQASSRTGWIFISFRGSHFLDNFSFRVFLAAVGEECKPSQLVKVNEFFMSNVSHTHYHHHTTYFFRFLREEYIHLQLLQLLHFTGWLYKHVCLCRGRCSKKERASEWLLFVIRIFQQNWQ